MNIISRKLAQSLNLVRFYTGRTCINGHLAERYVSTGTCVKCLNGDRIPSSKSIEEKIRILESEIATLPQTFEKERADLQLKIDKSRQLENEIMELKIATLDNLKNAMLNVAQNETQTKVRIVSSSQAKEILKEYVVIKITVHPNDVEFAKSLVHSYAISENPDIRLTDVWVEKRPKFGILYRVKCNVINVKDIRAWADQSYAKYQLNNDRIALVQGDKKAVLDTIDYSHHDQYRE